ncbi:MAG: chorismate-binding protein [Muribaculaceae bacterium]
MKKMQINDRTRKKVDEALSSGKSFMLYRIPSYSPKFVDAANKKADCYITPWREKFENSILVNESDVIAEKQAYPIPESTSRQQYIRRLEGLIETLNIRGKAKTVISRIISGKNDCNWIDVAEDLWNAFPDSFGYLFYTPKTGAWLGATPEKMLIAYPPNHFSTQALAGTLPADADWNVKNYEEQQIVVDYIEQILNDTKTPFKAIGPKEVVYGKIKHLSTSFTGLLNQDEPFEHAKQLLNRLAPTPALAGYPKGDAFDDIDEIEDHERYCYGGYITVLNKGTGNINSYVTIRCVQFDPHTGKWALYAGGGITPKSDPSVEWEETEAKASKLIEIIQCNTDLKNSL